MGIGSRPEVRVDRAILREYLELDGDAEDGVLVALLKRFQISAPARLADLREAVDTQSASNLRFFAHALKNLAGNVGAARLSRILLELERCGESDCWNGVTELLDLVSEELEEACEELRQIQCEPLRIRETPG